MSNHVSPKKSFGKSMASIGSPRPKGRPPADKAELSGIIRTSPYYVLYEPKSSSEFSILKLLDTIRGCPEGQRKSAGLIGHRSLIHSSISSRGDWLAFTIIYDFIYRFILYR